MDSPTPGSQLKASITDASLKIESIIDDAERAAADIRAEARADAEREARLLISDSASELAGVVEPVVKRVENLRVEAAALMHELESATMKLVELTKRTVDSSAIGAGDISLEAPPFETEIEETPPESPDMIEAEWPASPDPAPVAYPGTDANEDAVTDPPEEAVLRATQMAVAGNSRSEIEATLSDEFGLDNATPVVDEILGSA